MQSKFLITGLFALILLAGCVQNDSNTAELNAETSCPPEQEICILGVPGLLNDLSIYSDSETVFSIILRNNLKGDEARNVEVKLKNLSPFYVSEGYNVEINENNLSCSISNGIWKPAEIRESLFVPEPQFISDLGLPFASKMLDIMYPNEEVEFLWSLNAPSRQEIANVAYEHSIDYEVSYDYKSSILQTVYAINEQEYQRVLSLGEDISSRKGTTTSSIGALNVESNIEEPIRVSGENSQFSLMYKVNNKRSGIPLSPALFVFQYPNGTDFVGTFVGKNSLNSYSYIDLKAAAEYYANTPDSEKLICLPDDFDKYDQKISEFYSGDNKGTGICITYDEMIDYIVRNFKDLDFNRSSPNIVLKFIYPINLLNEMNPLYFPMVTTENIDISKYYTFRLKTKYRYSFSGSDDIIIIPSEKFYAPVEETESVNFFGDMGFNLENNADSYLLSNETLNMKKGNYTVNSSIFELNNGDFLHLVKFNSTKPLLAKSCNSDSDCAAIISDSNCNMLTRVCNYAVAQEVTTAEDLNVIANPAAKSSLNAESKNNIAKYSAVFSSVLGNELFCDKGILTANLFVNLKSGNFSFYIQSGERRENIQPIRTIGEGFYAIGPLILNCSEDAVNTLILNSTYDNTSADLIDLVIFNDSRIIKDDFLLSRLGGSSGYLKLTLDNSSDYYSMESVSAFSSGDRVNHYIRYKMAFGEVDYSLNASKYTLNSVNWQYLSSSYTATSNMNSIDVTFRNTNSGQKDAMIYLAVNEPSILNFDKLNHSVITYRTESMIEPYFYNIKVGYSPRDGFLKKVYDNTQSYISLNAETYYVNHLPYSVKSSEADRSAISNHELVFEGTISEKLNNIINFIDYKSFIELNEINMLTQDTGLVNVFSDSDLIGYQLKDYDYATAQYLSTIPASMKIMSYNEGESVFFKRFDIGDNAYSLIILYSDALTPLADRLMFYIIDHKGGNNAVRSDYFNISLLSGNIIASNKIMLNSTINQISLIKKDSYEQLSSLINLKSVAGVYDCSANYNVFGQEVNKKPVLKIDFDIKYGGNEASPLTYQSSAGTVIISDYASIAEANLALGTSLSSSANFVRGVVSVCKI
jgi:hypothetical protein